MKSLKLFFFIAIYCFGNSVSSQTTMCHNKEIVGYYPNWQWYDRDKLVNPASINYEKYTILNYCFFDVDINGNILITDPWADKNLLLGPIDWSVAPAGYDTEYDFGNPNYHLPNQKMSDYCQENGVTFLPSIGGWTLSNNFPSIAADPQKRQNFANSCVDLIQAFEFDGIDLDWEYPGYTPHNGTSADKENFTLLLQEIRTAIDAYGESINKDMLLTIAVGAAPDRMDDVEWDNVSSLVDIINVMSYDFFGAFSPSTNHNSPLYAPLEGDPTFNVHSTIERLVMDHEVPQEKITVGLAFYGRSSKTITTPALHSPTTGQVDDITYAEDEGSPLYYNILKQEHLFEKKWDNQAKVPYLLGKNGLNTFTSYDDTMSIRLKAEFIVDYDLRGAIIWEITGDYLETSSGSGIIGSTPLITQLNETFCNYTSILSVPTEPLNSGNIYPNPGTHAVFINIPNNESTEVAFVSTTGEKVLSTKVSNSEAINISTLSNGVYIVYLNSLESGETTKYKFIKQ
jgi:chitinase